jgi:uncharacterized protein YdhG (YjbR/CyaY superfamily)
MPVKAQTIDEFLAALPADQRAALETLRRHIHAAAPNLEECINYGVPAVRLDGKMLVAFGAGKKHCSFYPGAYPIAAHAEELQGYDTSKGTVRFAAERVLPAGLVRKLVRARVAERGARGARR